MRGRPGWLAGEMKNGGELSIFECKELITSIVC